MLKLKFSVIIPLEYHRDLAERCIQAWTQQRDFPRESFELLLSLPARFDEADLMPLAQMLAPHDRVIRLPHEHDMPLVSQAAHEAQGEVLIFTEAHCLPEPDFLKQCMTVLAEQRQWAGFSCRSIPLTHNLLSEIEAEMYSADIQRNMQEHPWLKVLDQCLVIRRDAYWDVGGVEPEFTHFAEWVFAARLYRKGYQIGYDERPAVSHYYIGDLEALEEFTLDFVAGQMRFAQSANQDPCGDLFDEVPEWTQRQIWNPQVAARMTKLLLTDWRRTVLGKDSHASSRWQQWSRWPWRTAAEWSLRRILSLPLTLKLLRMRSAWQRAVVQWHLRRGHKPQAKAAFLRLMALWAQTGKLNYLSRLPHHHLESEHTQPLPYSQWLPAIRQTLPSVGMHGFEVLDQVEFRWTKPAAMIWLPPLKGDWRIKMEWMDIVPFSQRQAARFYVNEQRIPSERITHRDNLTEFIVSSDGRQAVRLSWVCDAFAVEEEARRIGLPLSRVSWLEVGTLADQAQGSLENLPDHLNAPQTASIYFLHVMKCAGTATRLLLTNTFAAREILFAYNVALYYARQLKSQPELHAPYAFVSGHFGWELAAQVTNRKWRIVTIVRDPQERVLSQFDYLSQHKRLPSESGLRGWLEKDLRADDLLLPYFVPGLMGAPQRGIKPLSRMMAQHLSAALANLRSCEAVGLQERLDDSLNLICAATGSLPPRRTSRVNVTLRRTPRTELDAKAMKLLSEGLRVERELYAAAQALFEKQRARLYRQLSEEVGRELDTEGVRDVLRRKFFARRSNEYQQQGIPAEINWSPDGEFIGHNLYDRERHTDYPMRWTGPDAETTFYFPVKMGSRHTITIGLHSATPSAHVEGTQLFFNEAEVPLEWSMASDGYVLTGEFDCGPPPSDCGIFSEFRLETPIQRGTGEFRELGVALQSIRLERHAEAERRNVAARANAAAL